MDTGTIYYCKKAEVLIHRVKGKQRYLLQQSIDHIINRIGVFLTKLIMNFSLTWFTIKRNNKIGSMFATIWDKVEEKHYYGYQCTLNVFWAIHKSINGHLYS